MVAHLTVWCEHQRRTMQLGSTYICMSRTFSWQNGSWLQVCLCGANISYGQRSMVASLNLICEHTIQTELHGCKFNELDATIGAYDEELFAELLVLCNQHDTFKVIVRGNTEELQPQRIIILTCSQN